MDGSTKWIKTTVKYMSETGIHSGKLRTESKADVKKLMYSWDKKLWIEDIGSKWASHKLHNVMVIGAMGKLCSLHGLKLSN